jgi:hypothetical protein
VRAPVLQTGGRRFKSSTAHLKLEVDKKALEFIREKGGRVWVKSACVSSCCGIEGFEPQFSFKEDAGEYEEFEFDGVKIYIHRGALRFKKLAILLQKVLGYKSLIGYFA